MTDEDLEFLVAHLGRASEEGGEPSEEEAAALCRYEKLREVVRSEH